MAKRHVSVSEEEIQLPVTKIPRLPGTKKLAIFCHSVTEANGFELYVVNHDMDSIYGNSEYVEIKPRIQYSGDENWVGCVLNSTLYIFHECRNKLDYVNENGTDEIPAYGGPPPTKSAKKFDLSPEFLDSGTEIQGIDEFVPLSPMKWPKNSPIAVPTPDGEKILVFQSVIEVGCARTCFELYDPLLNLWTEVDPPASFPQWRFGLKYIFVSGYSFVDESSFVLFTDAGTFVLHLKSSEKKNVDVASLEAHFFSCHSVIIDGEVAIGPRWASRFRSGNDCWFEVSPPPCERAFHEPEPFIVLLKHDKDYADTLVSQTHLYKTFCGSSYLTIDVCRTNLATLNTNVLGTLKYVIFSGNGLLTLSMYFI